MFACRLLINENSFTKTFLVNKFIFEVNHS